MSQISEDYVRWANSLDSAGQDSSDARARAIDPVTMMQIKSNMESIIEVGHQTEALKKFVFYGKESDVRIGETPMLTSHRSHGFLALNDHSIMRVYHAIIGLVGEASELLEGLYRHVFEGEYYPLEALTDEGGDILWYMALIAHALDQTNFDSMMLGNRAKLTKRYGTKWSREQFDNRDKGEEMKALVKATDGYESPITPQGVAISNEKIKPMEVPINQLTEALEKFPTLSSIVSQLSACGYRSRFNIDIENNLAFIALRHYAYEQFKESQKSKYEDRDSLD